MLLTAADVAQLAAHLGIPERDFIDRHTVLASNRGQLSLAEAPEGACVFLENNACRVYAARPAQCRDFPAGWSVPGCPAGAGGEAEPWGAAGRNTFSPFHFHAFPPAHFPS